MSFGYFFSVSEDGSRFPPAETSKPGDLVLLKDGKRPKFGIFVLAKRWSQSIVNTIENENSTKLLGVLISDDLKWNNRINTTCKMVIPYCYALNRTNKTLNISVIKSIYYVQIFSLLKYSIVSWGSSPHAKKLSQMQNCTVRSILGDKKSTSWKQIFEKLRSLPLSSIFIYECACFI